MPRGLGRPGEVAYEKTMEFLRKHNLLFTGGCKAFYSPEYWREHAPDTAPENAALIIVHDGGELTFLDWNRQRYDLIEEFQNHIAEHFRVEQVTCWYSAIFVG